MSKDQVEYMFKDIDLTPVIELIKHHDISGWFGNNEGGESMRFFQNCFAEMTDTKYAYATSSGSAAIYVALRACGVGRGDNVIVPSYTHVGSVAPILLAGARPIFVDVDINGTLDPAQVQWEPAKALIAVHMLGMPCNMDEIRRNFDGFIIEDASHAFGAEYKSKKCGSLGDLAAFSIGGGRTKTIGCGEGGMVTTNNTVMATKIKNIRNHGDRVTDADYLCFNFRMSELNALLGLLQLPRVQMMNDWQMNNAKRIITELPPSLTVPKAPPYAKTVRYIIGALMCKEMRQDFLNKLIKNGWNGGMPRMNIGSGWSKLVHEVKFYKKFHKIGSLPVSERLRDEAVWIDWHRYPRTEEEITVMLKHVREALK